MLILKIYSAIVEMTFKMGQLCISGTPKYFRYFRYFSGLCYKHMTIVNDNSSIISEQSFQLIDDSSGVIYDHRMFIIQSSGLEGTAELWVNHEASVGLDELQVGG